MNYLILCGVDRIMKIAIAGTGSLGLSSAILLAQYNEVLAVDVITELDPVADVEIEDYLSNKELNFTTTLDKKSECKGTEYVNKVPPN